MRRRGEGGREGGDGQKVGMMMSFAPRAMSSRKASGKARSQQMRRPTGPRGVWMMSCGSCLLDVRWGRSGCLCLEEGGCQLGSMGCGGVPRIEESTRGFSFGNYRGFLRHFR